MMNKMRAKPDSLKIVATAEQTKDHPAHFIEIKLSYHLSGNIAPEKILKAIEMSMTKYCGVSYMLSRSCPITYQAFLNQQLIGAGQAKFE
jgi:putative redox protein